jgi:hypothetical protein
MCNAVGAHSWLYVTQHGLGLASETLHRVRGGLYAQVLGLDGYAAVPRVGLGPTTPP